MNVTIGHHYGQLPRTLTKDDLIVTQHYEPLTITGLIPLRGDRAGLELFLLVDNCSSCEPGSKFEELSRFIGSQPPTTAVGVAYILNGRLQLAENPTKDHERAIKALSTPTGNKPASPFIALADLIRSWPQTTSRRVVLMISNGINPAATENYQDPTAEAALQATQRAGVTVYVIYHPSADYLESDSSKLYSGQVELSHVADETGGEAYFLGFGPLPSLAPFLTDMADHLANRYLLEFLANPVEGSGALEQVTVKSKITDLDMMVPDKVWVCRRRNARGPAVNGILKLAYKLLVNDKAKFTALLVGNTFAVFGMMFATSMFSGVLFHSFSTVSNIGASIWIMDPAVQTVANSIGMPDYVLDAVRSMQGVKYAVPLYSGGALVKLPDGNYQSVSVLGLDDTSLFGRPELMEGKIQDIYAENGFIVVHDADFVKLGNPHLGSEFQLNDHRGVIVGIAKVAASGLFGIPTLYTTYKRAVQYIPNPRYTASYILAEPKNPGDVQIIKQQVKALGYLALTKQEFMQRIKNFYVYQTGMGTNILIMTVISFIVGLSISGQTFYTFILENLERFGALKAIGTRGRELAADGSVPGYLHIADRIWARNRTLHAPHRASKAETARLFCD